LSKLRGVGEFEEERRSRLGRVGDGEIRCTLAAQRPAATTE
jgi:hypothetical protein